MHILPQLRKLEEKYADILTVVGVHSAKFNAEKSPESVRAAIRRYGIDHPVVNDVDFEIWKSYAVSAWPTLMFLDPNGKVIVRHEGEFAVDALDQVLTAMIDEHEPSGNFVRGKLDLLPETQPETQLSFPGKVTVDAEREILVISDSNHRRIVVSNLDGNVETVIGNGESPLSDIEHPGVFTARSFDRPLFENPQGVVIEGETLYVSDAGTHTIVEINLITRTAETIAGTGEQSLYRHQGGDALDTPLNSPYDISLHQEVLYVAMAGFHQLWSMNIVESTVTPFAGDGIEDIHDDLKSNARLAQPYGIEVSNNAVFFIDSETSSLRVSSIADEGRVVTLVGKGLFDFGDADGVGKDALFQHPQGLTVSKDVIYIADSYNNKIKSVAIGSLEVCTVAGSGIAGDMDGNSRIAQFSEPAGVAVGGDRIYVADTNNHKIKIIELDTKEVHLLELTGL
jgi:DNA-binding beta-propeller fold protein YncE